MVVAHRPWKDRAFGLAALQLIIVRLMENVRLAQPAPGSETSAAPAYLERIRPLHDLFSSAGDA